jgi:hypothetical protein
MTDDLSERVPEQISEARLDLLAKSMAELLAASMSYRGRTPIEVSVRNCRRIISAYVQANGHEPGSINALARWWEGQQKAGHVRFVKSWT